MAEAMLRELRSFPLLDGYRGSPLVDRAALVRCMAHLSRFVLEQGHAIEELELNPACAPPPEPTSPEELTRGLLLATASRSAKAAVALDSVVRVLVPLHLARVSRLAGSARVFA
jgi:hypothetical protein